MAIYDRLKSTAERLIGQYGRPCALVRQTQSGPDYDPVVTESTYTVQALETGYSLTSRNDTLVQVGDKLGLISTADEAPRFDDKIEIDGDRYSFVDLQPLNPGGTTLLFEFQARR